MCFWEYCKFSQCQQCCFDEFFVVFTHGIGVAFYVSSGAPVSTTLGFCLTLFPLLSFVGEQEDYFIQMIPESELSTPENYLYSLTNNSCEELSAQEQNEGSGELLVEDTIDQATEDSPTNEQTPLLA